MVVSALFFKAFFLSFALAIPVGPVGIFCIRRVAAHGALAGYVAAIAVALADACYAIIAGFSSAALTDLFLGHKLFIAFLGGVFLVLAGIRFLMKKPVEKGYAIAGVSLMGTFIAAFSLTLANPGTIMVFFGVFSIAKAPAVLWMRLLVLLAIVAGSFAWWVLLTTLVWLLKKRRWITDGVISWVNVVAACLIIVCGAYVMARSGYFYLKRVGGSRIEVKAASRLSSLSDSEEAHQEGKTRLPGPQ